MKKLTKKQIVIIQLAAFLFICFFGIGFFVFSRQQGNEKLNPAADTSIIYQKGKLTVYEDAYRLFPDTDRVAVHNQYFLVVEPRKEKTTVYDQQLHKKVTVLAKIALDYDGKNVLYNKSGIDTHFNDLALGLRCASGYIKSETEILCIVPKNDDNLDNKLVSINPLTLETTDIYSSDLTLQYVSSLENKIYIGAFSLQPRKQYLVINGKQTKVPDSVNVLFEKEGNVYFGSFQNRINKHTENYYLTKQTGEGAVIQLIEKGRIVF